MWHKAEWIGHPMRIELTRVGLLVKLANRYTTKGARSSENNNSYVYKNNVPIVEEGTNKIQKEPFLLRDTTSYQTPKQTNAIGPYDGMATNILNWDKTDCRWAWH